MKGFAPESKRDYQSRCTIRHKATGDSVSDSRQSTMTTYYSEWGCGRCVPAIRPRLAMPVVLAWFLAQRTEDRRNGKRTMAQYTNKTLKSIRVYGEHAAPRTPPVPRRGVHPCQGQEQQDTRRVSRGMSFVDNELLEQGRSTWMPGHNTRGRGISSAPAWC